MENKRDKIQKEILDSLQPFPHGLIKVAPRVGKTRIIVNLIKRDKLKKVLWVTQSTKLRDINIPEEFIKTGNEELLKNIDIVCWRSLYNVTGEYDTIIFDEYQHITLRSIDNFFNHSIEAKNIIGISGTHPKDKDKQKLLDFFELKTIYEMEIDDAVDQNLLANYNITVVKVPLSEEFNIEVKSKKSTYRTSERKLYERFDGNIKRLKKHNEEQNRNGTTDYVAIPKYLYYKRTAVLYELQSKIDAAKAISSKLKGRILAFTPRKKQAEQLFENFYHSDTSANSLQGFIDGKIDRLACVSSGGTGETYENVDHLIITQVNSDKNGDITQKICRSLLKQDNFEANVIVLVSEGTRDEEWLEGIRGVFEKIETKSFKEYMSECK